MVVRNILFGTAAFAALTSCDSNKLAHEDATSTKTREMVEAAEPANADNALLPATPQGFVATMAASNGFKIESSQIAQEMANSPELVQFAKMIVSDHTKLLAELEAAAVQAQPALSVSPIVTPEQQDALSLLRSATAADFDELYLRKQIEAHQDSLSLLHSYSSTGEVPPLRQFASKAAPVVIAHLQAARELNQSR